MRNPVGCEEWPLPTKTSPSIDLQAVKLDATVSTPKA